MKGWDVNVGRCNLNKFYNFVGWYKIRNFDIFDLFTGFAYKETYLWGIPEKLDSGHLNSGCLDAWALNASTLDNWMLGLWMPGPWTLGPRKFYWFLVTSIPLLLLFTVEFLSISNALWLMCYGSIEIATNS